MKKSISLIIAVLSTHLLFSQTISNKITVTIQTDKGSLLENTTIQLLRAKDSSLIKVAISDSKGIAEFNKIRLGSYLLKATHVNQQTTYSPEFKITDSTGIIRLPALSLLSSGQLKEVVVNNKKPFIQKLSDRIVVNVDNSIVNAGSSAMEVLERSPGVSVDQNDAIGLRGRQGVIVMIDGKISPMSGSDLANYLRGLPSSAIDRIDIITNPSAKYDAAGNSGIIDIHLKKDQRLGANGTFNTGYGQGIYPKANAGTTFNYRNKKINIFGNYTYSYRKGLNHLVLDRNFYTNTGDFSGEDNKDNYGLYPYQTHAFRVGTDYYISKKTIIGFSVNGSFNHPNHTNDNSSVVLDNKRVPIYTFKAITDDHNILDNGVGNINFKHTFDSTGKEITADIDYGRFYNKGKSSTDTRYAGINGTPVPPEYILTGNQVGNLTLRTGKIDYSNPLKKGAKIELGTKLSHVSTDNDSKFYDASSGTPQNDINKTNHFLYDEYNYAGYVNFSKEFKKYNIQLGLRGEQTKLNTHQLRGDLKFDTSYFQLFPSAFFNYKIKEDQTIGVSVSRRIDRPGYNSLNPFLFLIDVTTYLTGNPSLLPQLTWSYELSYTMKAINFTLGYSHTVNDQNIAVARFKDVFPNIPSADNVTLQIPINLNSSDYFGLTVAAPIKINSWWNMINNANAFYNHYNGSLGATNLHNGSPALDASINNNFTLSKKWTAELNGRYNSGGQYGFMVSKPQGGVSAGLAKSVLQKKGTVKLNFSDIFWSDNPSGIITYNNYKEYWHAHRETRVLSINFTYRFGKNTIQAARKRTTASEEERKRAGN